MTLENEMRFYPKGQPDFSLTQTMEGLMAGGKELVRITGEIDDDALTTTINGRVVPYCVELGVGYPPDVTEKLVQAFFARPDVQAKLRRSLRLMQQVQKAMLKEFDPECVDTTEDMVKDHAKRLKKQAAAQ